jgi:hypothetical protein
LKLKRPDGSESAENGARIAFSTLIEPKKYKEQGIAEMMVDLYPSFREQISPTLAITAQAKSRSRSSLAGSV